MKRILTMQDICCFGKCSLTVALPVISAAEVECAVLPTALLSAHTGGLGEVYFRDLADGILSAAAHIKQIGAAFDGVYIGYLGSLRQIELAKEVVRMFRAPENFLLLDPVMGDRGSLYRRIPAGYAAGMAELAELADYCVPNLTEAALLAGIPYPGERPRPDVLDGLLAALAERYPARFIVTGVSDGEQRIGATLPAGRAYTAKRYAGRFHGTGDLFASALAAALARRVPLEKAIALCVDFTAAVVARTAGSGKDERWGLDFESCLWMLPERIRKETQ